MAPPRRWPPAASAGRSLPHRTRGDARPRPGKAPPVERASLPSGKTCRGWSRPSPPAQGRRCLPQAGSGIPPCGRPGRSGRSEGGGGRPPCSGRSGGRPPAPAAAACGTGCARRRGPRTSPRTRTRASQQAGPLGDETGRRLPLPGCKRLPPRWPAWGPDHMRSSRRADPPFAAPAPARMAAARRPCRCQCRDTAARGCARRAGSGRPPGSPHRTRARHPPPWSGRPAPSGAARPRARRRQTGPHRPGRPGSPATASGGDSASRGSKPGGRAPAAPCRHAARYSRSPRGRSDCPTSRGFASRDGPPSDPGSLTCWRPARKQATAGRRWCRDRYSQW